MLASTTQNTLVNSNNDIQQESTSRRRFSRTLSILEKEEFNSYIQQQYGAYWGTLKFEDSLSDYSNEVNFIKFIYFYSYLT